MARKRKEVKQTMIDPNGNTIPVEYLDPNLVMRDQLVNSLFSQAIQHRMILQNFKQSVKEQVKQYLNDLANQYNEDWKGNTAIYNFAQDRQIEINISEFQQFDEKLQIAKQKIDKCVSAWSEGSRKEIKTLITDVFQLDKKGNINTKRVLGLRQYKFDDPLWTEAMELISDSIVVSNTKQYINFKKKNKEGKWINISLNWSNL